MAVLIAAGAAYALGWHGLELEKYFLGRRVSFSDIALENSDKELVQSLHYFQWRVSKRMAWGELIRWPGLGLEEQLVEESYRCTQSVSMRFREIAGLEIQPGTVITVMLRSGLCPSKAAAR